MDWFLHRLKSFFTLSVVCILIPFVVACGAGQPAQPQTSAGVSTQAAPTPEQGSVILESIAKFRAGDLEGSLAYFADDAEVHLVGAPPGQPDSYQGKEAIRAWWQDLQKQNFDIQVEVQKVEGDQVTTRTKTWLDSTRALGVAPVEAIEVYVVRDGEIQSATWTISPESGAKLSAALATAQAPTATNTSAPTATMAATSTPTETAGTPTPTFSAPVAVQTVNDVAGLWSFRFEGEPYTIEFLEDGTYRVGFEDNLSAVESGKYSVEKGQLHYLTATRECVGAAQEADYEVYVIKQEDRPVGLRFTLLGDDPCLTRKNSLIGKTLTPVKP